MYHHSPRVSLRQSKNTFVSYRWSFRGMKSSQEWRLPSILSLYWTIWEMITLQTVVLYFVLFPIGSFVDSSDEGIQFSYLKPPLFPLRRPPIVESYISFFLIAALLDQTTRWCLFIFMWLKVACIIIYVKHIVHTHYVKAISFLAFLSLSVLTSSMSLKWTRRGSLIICLSRGDP
jgi:hypothetical protein